MCVCGSSTPSRFGGEKDTDRDCVNKVHGKQNLLLPGITKTSHKTKFMGQWTVILRWYLCSEHEENTSEY